MARVEMIGGMEQSALSVAGVVTGTEYRMFPLWEADMTGYRTLRIV
jgi:hypothetical protein